MSLPDSALVGLTAERGDGNQSIVFRIKAGGFPVRTVGRQWRMEFWNEARTVKFCDAAATPQVADGNVLVLTFTETELSTLPETFWGDLLVVLENGRRRYLLRVRGTATGSGILIGEVLIATGEPELPPEWTPLIDRALVAPLLGIDRNTGGDPHFANVSLLLHMDGADGGTAFPDSSLNNHSISVTGATTVVAQSRFGGSSGLFSGTSQQLRLPTADALYMGTGDFTVEGWIFRTDDIQRYFIDNRSGGSTSFIVNHTEGSKTIVFTLGGQAITYLNTPANSWVHLAFVRSNGFVRFYVNGVAAAEVLSDSTVVTFSQAVIGGRYQGSYGGYNYIDDVRITKGVARYTANFTPPTEPFPHSAAAPPYTPLQETFFRVDRALVASNMPYSRQLQLDPEFANISLLLHMDGNNGSTTFIDSSYNALAIVAVGNAQISTAQSRFGGASALFDGSGDYLSVASSSVLDLTADFTIEFFVYSTVAINGIGWVSRPNGAGRSPIRIDVSGSLVRVSVSSDGATFGFIFSGGLPSTSTWTHVAVTRAGDNWRIFVGGTQTASQVNSITPFTSTDPMLIGTRLTTSNFFNGSIDELRITKGLARYTANFTPPSEAFPDPPRLGYTPLQEAFFRVDRALVALSAQVDRTATGYGFVAPAPVLPVLSLSLSHGSPKAFLQGDDYFANVSLLLHMDGNNGSTTFTDSSSYAHVGTPRGDAQISTAQSKFGGASGFFDGSGDGLSIAENDALKLGTGDFTIEVQARRTGAGSGDCFLVELGNGAGYLFRWASGSTLQFYIANGLVCSYAFAFTLNTWFHLAVARAGSSVKMFVDGVEVASGASNSSASANSAVGVGSIQSGSGDNFQGYLDEVRITKGVARYTANFTPPTAPFPNGAF